RAFALRVLAATQEVAAAAAGPQLHRRAALGAGLVHLDLWPGRLLRGVRGHQRLHLRPLREFGRQRLVAATLRVAAARQVRPARPLLDDHLRVALLALDAGRHRPDRVAVGVHVQGVAALRVAGAGQERPAAAFADDHRAAALLALVLRRLRGDDRLALGVEIHGRLALGVAGAAQKRPTTRPAKT